jgi:hypothetical protein
MKPANKLAIATVLTAVSGLANAAIVNYTITGGNWDSISQWTAQSSGAPSATVYDNGQVPPCINCGPQPELIWAGTPPPAMTGTYGGTISVDTSNNAVVGGSLVVTGTIADMVVVGTTWWVREYNNLTINFATNTATTSSAVGCYGTIFAPVGCGPAVVNAGTTTSIFGPRAGNASQATDGSGTPYAAATFDVNTGLLQVFRDGRRPDATNGTDVLNRFTLQVVPVPAAAWLFGSALGLLGVARRKLAA